MSKALFSDTKTQDFYIFFSAKSKSDELKKKVLCRILEQNLHRNNF